MKKYVVIGLMIMLILALMVTAKPKETHKISLPSHAKEISPGVFSLGKAIDHGRVVEGYMFVYNKKRNAKPGTVCGNDVCEPSENAKKCPADCGGGTTDPPETSTCFAFISKGAKWKVVEDYIVDPSNNEGLSEAFVSANLAANIDKWEDVENANILGNEVAGVVDVANIGNLNDKNEVIIGDLDNSNTIAVTIVWGIFKGNPNGRELVEWDQVYNTDFNWSEDCTTNNCTAKMDFGNIANHELGHAMGMDHPSETCTEETMYAFASNGETKKITLEAGDIAGIADLY